MDKTIRLKTRGMAIWRVLLAVALAAGLMPAAVAITGAETAYAADARLDVGSTIEYAGYRTNWFTADGQTAYCAEPSQPTPNSGTYTKQSVSPRGWTPETVAKVIFYGYGGPGFDWGVSHGLWPSTWYDGSSMSAEKYAALTHIILSDVYAGDWASATRGTTESFKNWCKSVILQYPPAASPNPNATQAKIVSSPLPSDFMNYVYQLSTGSSSQVIVGRSAYNALGTIQVTKTSSNPSLTDSNNCYTFEGGVYGVYEDSGCTRSVGTITLNAAGTGTLANVMCNGMTYYVKEITAPTGYLKNNTVYSVTPTHQTTNNVAVSDRPGDDPDTMRVWKADAESATTLPEGAASVADAQFTFRYYAGYYTEETLPDTPTRTWVMKTTSTGVASPLYGNSHLISGDDFYLDEGGLVVVPLGTLTAIETTPPEGYLLDDGKGNNPKLFVSQVVADASDPSGARIVPVNYSGAENLQTYNTPISADTVYRGNLQGKKSDSATTDGTAQGAATLEGAEISVVNRNENAVMSPQTGEFVEYGGTVCVLKTDAMGNFSTTNAGLNGWAIPDGTDSNRVDGNGNPLDMEGKALAYGDYYVYESKAPAGYNLNNEWSALVTVESDGQVLTADFTDDVIRGDFEFTKTNSRTQRRLAGIPFVVTSQTTGERHIVVSDENGTVSTEAAFTAHTDDTNGMDAAVTSTVEDGKTVYTLNESLARTGFGTWFNGQNDATGAAENDAVGALPYDTYLVEEVRCAANNGLDLVSFPVTISRNSRTVYMGTVDDQLSPVIRTTLLDESGTHTVAPDSAALLVDTISYGNFEAGKYTFKGELHAIDAEGSDTGVIATNTKQIDVAMAFGTVDMSFVVSTERYNNQGYRFVATEECYNEDEELVAEHKDLTDELQTVLMPKIETTLTDLADGDHEVPSAGTVTLTDSVAYEGLTPEKRYTMSMELHKVAGDGSDAGVLTDAHGNVVSATQKFTPNASSGTVEVSVTFEPDEGGYDVVAFETLTLGEIEYAVHADIDDEAQTVHMPGVATTALDARTAIHAAKAGDEAHFVDYVEYSALTPGKSYTLTGTIHVKNAQGTDIGAFKDASGNDVTAETTFIPESASGTVQMPFDADVQLDPGMTAVVYEALRAEGTVTTLAEHADINSDDQSVHAPRIGTKASIAADGQEGTYADSTQTLTVKDVISYENLPAGVEYTAIATLHKAAANGEDEGVVEADGTTVSGTAKFTPEDVSGQATVEIALDPKYATGNLVVFEQVGIYRDGAFIPVATHEDIADKEQTVSVAGLQTTATDKETGTHEGEGEAAATVVDVVAYEGLEPNQSYELAGVLMDKSTGEPIMENDAPVSATLKFSPDAPNGEREMQFEMKNTVLDGLDVVVFEVLSDSEGNVVATHEDINSESQTVSYSAPGWGSAFAKAGNWLLGHWWLLLAAGAIALAAGAWRRMGTGFHPSEAGAAPEAPANVSARQAARIAREHFKVEQVTETWDFNDRWVFSAEGHGRTRYAMVKKAGGVLTDLGTSQADNPRNTE